MIRPSVVLVVEDNDSKKEIINSQLGEIADDVEVEILYAGDRDSAYIICEQRLIDLLILDLCVPISPDGEVIQSGGRLLLEMLRMGEFSVRPFVLGLTSYQEERNDQGDYFDGEGVAVVHFDEEFLWVKALSETFKTIVNAIESREKPVDIDFIILATTDVEYSALENAIGFGQQNKLFTERVYWSEIERSGKTLRGLCVKPDGMGPAPSAAVVSKILVRYKPAILGMVGICAGLDDDLEIGDLVLFKSVHSWDQGKWSDEDGKSVFMPEMKTYSIDSSIETYVLDRERDGFLTELYKNASGERPANAPRIRSGHAVSGSSVVASEEVVRRIKQTRKPIGLDMETYGLYASIQTHRNRPRYFFSLKTVVDHGTKGKGDDWQKYGSIISSSLGIDVVIGLNA